MNFKDKLDIKCNVPSRKIMERTKDSWNKICKPLGSLGLLEEYVIKLSGIFGTDKFTLDKRCAVIVCADNGVISEGVTQTGKDVTMSVAESIAEGIANINVMAASSNIDTFVVDVGIDGEVSDKRIINMKIDYGTKNIKNGPAMSRKQAIQGINAGMEIVKLMKDKGYRLIATGEMGIGYHDIVDTFFICYREVNI